MLSAVEMTVVYSVAVLVGLAALCGVILALLGKKFAVHEDEKVKQIRERLSGANCGACGYAGCDAFAKALAEGKAELSACAPTSAENKKLIAGLLGVEAGGGGQIVVVACRGGNDAADKYEYMGYGNCRSMVLLSGGRKQCDWGCLGTGSCTDACPAHAVEVNECGYAQIDRDLCISCGKCITACPKSLIKQIPQTAKIYVACSNCARGREVKAVCRVGCVACGVCERACPNGAIKLDGNLPIINYGLCDGCGVCVEKCISKCILHIGR